MMKRKYRLAFKILMGIVLCILFSILIFIGAKIAAFLFLPDIANSGRTDEMANLVVRVVSSIVCFGLVLQIIRIHMQTMRNLKQRKEKQPEKKLSGFEQFIKNRKGSFEPDPIRGFKEGH